MGQALYRYRGAHILYVVGDGIRIPYHGIVGQDFFISKKAIIDYKKRKVIMGNMRLNFDDRVLSDKQVKEINIVLKAR
jgi:hypothetical protein